MNLEMISAGVLLPLWLVGVMFVSLMIVSIAFMVFFKDIKRFAPEAVKFKDARKKNLPLLMVHDASGKCEIILGKKKKKGDVMYDTEAYGIFLDQNMQGMPPEDRTIDGVRMYHYATSFPFPISGKNARALETILKHVRSNYPQLNQIQDLEVIEIIGTDADELVHDCENLVKAYDLKIADFSIDPNFSFDTTGAATEEEKDKLILFAISSEMARLIHKIQDEVSTQPVNTGFFSYTHAFKLIPSAFLSQDVHQLKILMERLVRKESGEKMKEMMAYGTLILMMLVGAGIAYKLISG